jgi:L-threonylcarbamoyladenylate synthase
LIGPIELAGAAMGAAHPAPGMHPKHYSPRTPLMLNRPPAGRGAYLWLTRHHETARSIHMPADPAQFAAALYETLHCLDEEHLDWIAVELPPDEPEWAGIRDRLQRAAAT